MQYRPHLILAIAIILFSCLCAKKGNAQFAHQQAFYLRNLSPDNIYITRITKFLKGSFPYSVKPGSDSFYKYPQLMRNAEFINFTSKNGNNKRTFWVAPGDSLIMKYEGDLCKIIAVDDSSKNNELKFLNTLFEDIKESSSHYLPLLSKTIPLKERDKLFQDIYERQIEFIIMKGPKYGLSRNFIDKVKQLMLAKMIINKFQEQVHNYKYASDLKKFYKNEFITYIDSLNDKGLKDSYELKLAALYLNEVVTYPHKASFEKTKQFFNRSPFKEFLLSKYLYDRINSNDTSVNKYLAEYYSICLDIGYVNDIKTLEILKRPGRHVAENGLASLINSKGEQTTFTAFLNQNKGKIIYLDFWATWCLPCIKEMPNSARLRSEYRNRNIAFAYISIDDDIKSWQEHEIAQSFPPEVSSFTLVNNDNNELLKAVKLTDIPRYIIIDKEGGFYNLNAPRPGSLDVRKMLNSLLDK